MKGKNYKTFALFVAPAVLFFLVIMLVPLISAFGYSFTNWRAGSQTISFVGLNNYIELFKDDIYFRNSLMITLKYTIIVVIGQNILALLLAVLVEQRNKSKNIFRTLFFLPNMISLMISAFIWSFIFTIVLPQLAEYGLSFLDQGWLGDPDVALYSIIIVSIWRGAGYMMLIYIAGLQGVPEELKEASVIDGASSWQTFVNVTLPSIRHAITISIFLTLKDSFMAFDVAYGLTNGGPGRATQVVAMNIYEEAFSGNFRYGYANAKAMVLFVIILIVTFTQVRLTSGKDEN